MRFTEHLTSPSYRAASLALTLLVSGCLAYEQDGSFADPAAVDALGASVIGGFEAVSAKLNAVGSISIMSVEAAGAVPTFEEQCTGALIGPRTVLTAKHCLLAFTNAVRFNDSLVFGLGPDAAAPLAYATVLDTAGAPGDDGGYTNQGHDVGVLQLDRPLVDVPVVSLASASDAELGQQFIGIGYGQESNASKAPLRRLGALTLRARAGRTYELLYGNFEAYYRVQMGGPPPTGCPAPGQPAATTLDEQCMYVDTLRKIYDDTRLEQVEELALGAGPGDAQPCYGDSGGPLLRAGPQGELIAYGVAIGGVPSDELVCDHGAIYASLGAEVKAFLMQAVSWRDPCELLPPAGACNGERARRCSTAAEGHRRVVEVDCSLAGLQCIADEKGATCGERAMRMPRP